MGLTPTFRIIANNQDVTQHIKNNLISLSFNDQDGFKADKIELKVSGDFKRPKYKDKLKLYLSYEEESKEFYCGLFIVQNTSLTNLGVLTITASAINLNNSLKELKNRSFTRKSIKVICSKIASEHGMLVKCDMQRFIIGYVAQTNESDLVFLKRLAQEYYAVFSIKNNTIIFLSQDDEKHSSLPSVTINANDCLDDTPIIKNSNKTYYSSINCKYQDTKENKIGNIKIGSGEPTYQMQTNYIDKKNLEQQAKAKLRSLNKGIKSGSFKISGRAMYAKSLLRFENIKDEDNVLYQIDKIRHDLSENGWISTVEFSNV